MRTGLFHHHRGFPCPGWKYPYLKGLILDGGLESVSDCLSGTFDDGVDARFQGWTRVRENYTWREFSERLCERFEERSMSNTIEEFNKLK